MKFYKQVVDEEERFIGFISGNSVEEIEEKKKKFATKGYTIGDSERQGENPNIC